MDYNQNGNLSLKLEHQRIAPKTWSRTPAPSGIHQEPSGTSRIASGTHQEPSGTSRIPLGTSRIA